MSIEVQPLSGPPPDEVPLTGAPLVRVVAQVRFAPILAIRNPDKVAGFQEAIRMTYPNLAPEHMQHIALQIDGTPSFQDAVIWRFNSSLKSLQWRVSLGTDFVALETAAYQSRKDFLDRLKVVLDNVESNFRPSEAQRFGLRYVNRIVGEGFERADDLVSPSVLGISRQDPDAQSSLSRAIKFLMTEAHLEADEGVIQARWGHLPPNQTYDPDALEPLNKSSWTIDLDMFTRGPQTFVSDELLALATVFAERNYAVFREMVTPEFLNFYGGKA